MKEPEFIYQKNANSNKIVLPKAYTDKWGMKFYMKIYPDGTLIIEPIKKKGE